MSKPSERVWTVELFVPNPETGAPEHDPAALPNALLELVGLMARVGGVVQMASRRAEVAPGRIETIGVVFRWQSFVPVDKGGQEPPPAEAADPGEAEEFAEVAEDEGQPVSHESVVPAT